MDERVEEAEGEDGEPQNRSVKGKPKYCPNPNCPKTVNGVKHDFSSNVCLMKHIWARKISTSACGEWLRYENEGAKEEVIKEQYHGDWNRFDSKLVEFETKQHELRSKKHKKI